jgi:hypothetical protein
MSSSVALSETLRSNKKPGVLTVNIKCSGKDTELLKYVVKKNGWKVIKKL